MSKQRCVPDGWEVKRLRECITPIKRKVGVDKAIPMSLSAGIGFVLQSDRFGREIAGKQYEKYTLLKKGEFTYNKGNSKKYPQGCAYLLENYDEVSVPNVFISFKVNKLLGIDEFFKQYFIANLHGLELRKAINSGVRNNGLLNLNEENFYEINVFIPSISEQKRIAEVLGCWDEGIEKLERKISLKEQQKKGLMQRLLSGECRLPGFFRPWKEVKLGELSHITSAGVDKNIVEGEEKVLLLNYMDVYKKDFIYKNDVVHIVTAPDRQVKNCNLLRGDIFFTPSSETRDDIGRSAVVMEDIPKGVYSYHVVRLRPSLNELKPSFSAYAFKTSKFYEQVYRMCEGSGQRYVIRQDYFRNMFIYMPLDLEEQSAIADILSTADDEINLLKQKLSLFKQQKKWLMQQLLTGKKRLKIEKET
jgi:type I restriction enzyme S subunit